MLSISMGDYRSLTVWKAAHQFTLGVYQVTRTFPSEERFGLTSQLRRAAASIPANLAEGCGRDTDGEIARFTRIALGSASEAEYHLLLARDLKLIATHDHDRLAREIADIKRMLARFAASLTTDD